MNKFQQFLDSLTEAGGDHYDPDHLKFIIKNMGGIIHDYKDWQPEKVYKYMITFTLDPKKVNMTDENQKNQIEKYITNLIRKPEVLKAYYVREHSDTNTHWHVVVHRNTALRSDYLSYFKKTYGNVHCSRSKTLDDTHSIKYLSKESEIIIIV